MKRLQHLFIWAVGLELLGVLSLVAWQASRPQAPAPNLARLPTATASNIRRLQQETHGDRLSAWRELGEAYLAYGYCVEAEACLRRAATLGPRDFAAVYGWAYSLDRLGRLHGANQKFEAAAKLADADMARTCRYHIARNHLRNEDADAALRAFEQIEGFPAADHQRAKLLLAQGNVKQARPLIARLEEQVPDDIEVQLLVLQAERDQKPFSAIRMNRLERCRAILRLTDHWDYLQPIRSRHGLAAALARIESSANADQVMAAALHFEALMTENDFELLTPLFGRAAEFEFRAGRLDESQRMLDLLAERSEMHPRWMHLRGDVWHHMNQPQKAREAWTRASEHFPRAQSHEMLAEAANRSGDSTEAQRESGLANQAAGVAALRENQLTQALDHLEQALRFDPGNARTWFYLGEVQSALSHTEAASAAYRKCLELNPNHGRSLVRIAR